MKVVHVTCILLATIICSIASSVATPIQGENKSTIHQTVDVTTVPPLQSTTIINLAASSNAPIPTVNTTTAVNVTKVDTHTTAPIDVANKTTASSKIETTTISTTVPTTIVTTATTPKKPSTTTLKPTTNNVTSSTTTSSGTTVAPPSVTTTIPVSTKTPSYKGRHFDGLSFLGGIILTVCLMAIGVISWKFFRTMSEGNYRTL
ncbi:PREDICTED: cell wall integrity and stress response component 4-like [Dufourea novaeangliae]|uniref:cell wall integrity and stress response component 4-like n=1 Tax=Dufourea novaeangliae TaxID=178035 RepID=UPI000767807D|nr:PREDICTED: cell wall integrity and stress response component 4-like [Dufourea novaeangliae]